MTPRAAGFDDVVVVDWSASVVPKTGPDSCWVASGPLTGRQRTEVRNHPTRAETMRAVESHIDRSLSRSRRVMVAFDVSFGFPAGAAKVLKLEGRPAWRALWRTLEERIEDDDRNRNNRFDVADALNGASGTSVFWGRPVAASFDHLKNLSVRRVESNGLAPNPLPRLRACEELAGPGVISNWMLVGKGSVGGQVLTCLPYLERLRTRHRGDLEVWPFDGLGDRGAPVVLAETWFGLFDWKGARGTCRDESQVRGTHAALRALGPSGLTELLEPPSLLALSTRRQGEICNEEGWTLGVR